jgi:signal transduction histidine kinase
VAIGPTSLRARLALLFAVGSTGVLVLASALLYVDLSRELDASVNGGLRVRATDLAAAVRERSGRPDLPAADPYAQLFDGSGAVIDAAGAALAAGPVLTPAEVREARARGRLSVDRRVTGLEGTSRVLARPVSVRGASDVVVVATSLHSLERGQRRLALELAVAAPFLVGALAAGGWLLAAAALRPVERLTSEADRISLTEPSRRLPSIPGDDEIARLGRTLNAMLDRIQASFEHEQSFVDDASHELRTPVSILRAELELALVDARDGTAVEASLRSALEEAERLGHLADDLLVLARESAGRLPLRLETVDAAALVRRVASRLPASPPISVAGTAPRLAADPARLEQLVQNLLVNAQRHARTRVAVTLSADAMTVADDGAGFALDVLPRAFDRFTRDGSDRGRAGGGAGLGLAIVAAIARAHGWSAAAWNGGTLGGAVVRLDFDGQVA